MFSHFCCQIYDLFEVCRICLDFFMRPRKAQAFCFTITLVGDVKFIGSISVQFWKRFLEYSSSRELSWIQRDMFPVCAIFLFFKSKLGLHGLSINVPMATRRDSLRRPRSDEWKSALARIKGIWKRIRRRQNWFGSWGTLTDFSCSSIFPLVFNPTPGFFLDLNLSASF